ncbi:hypothetical protein [Floridanema aerugineum]|jgi:Flp pilus assembly protein TadB|uniref:Uncharacterized protein n=1 Tax=Floridaenema aerugineum BLCC-F46 TaxID=3153654 RepID=A0ABV4X945_9CYAN
MMQQITNKIPNEYMVTEDDARQYIRECAGSALMLITVYALFLAKIISPFVLFVVVALALPRWVINVHELMHIRK